MKRGYAIYRINRSLADQVIADVLHYPPDRVFSMGLDCY